MAARYGCKRGILDAEGQTPLYWACYFGHTHCVQLLLSVGADPKVASLFNALPLTQLLMREHSECVSLLLAAYPIPLQNVEERSEERSPWHPEDP